MYMHLQSYKMNMGSHYIAHLKIVEDNKLAMKEFDRHVPFEIEDLAMAAGLESTIPSRSHPYLLHECIPCLPTALCSCNVKARTGAVLKEV